MAWRFINWDRKIGVVIAEADSVADFKVAAARFLEEHGIKVATVEPREVMVGGRKLYVYQVPRDKLKHAA